MVLGICDGEQLASNNRVLQAFSLHLPKWYRTSDHLSEEEPHEPEIPRHSRDIKISQARMGEDGRVKDRSLRGG